MHWIIEVYEAVEIKGEIVVDMTTPARVCMTCRDEVGTVVPCLLEVPTTEEINNNVKTMDDLYKAAGVFADSPEWLLRDIIRADDVRQLNYRRLWDCRTLALAELHRRMTADRRTV